MATVYTPVRKKHAGEIAYDAAIDANDDTEVGGRVYTAGAAAVTLQVVPVSGAHTTHVVTLQGSVDGATWVATATTVTGAGAATLSNPVYPYHRAAVTTEEGGAGVVDVYVYAKFA